MFGLICYPIVKALIDLSTFQFDGSHTTYKQGGEAVGYQYRKSCKGIIA
jgi:hypothetical protein